VYRSATEPDRHRTRDHGQKIEHTNPPRISLTP
jgi:hypothetical protein